MVPAHAHAGKPVALAPSPVALFTVTYSLYYDGQSVRQTETESDRQGQRRTVRQSEGGSERASEGCRSCRLSAAEWLWLVDVMCRRRCRWCAASCADRSQSTSLYADSPTR